MSSEMVATRQQRLIRWLNLSYLLFLFMPLYFGHNIVFINVIITLASVVVFLPLYYFSIAADDWRLKVFPFLQIALCLMVLPYNYGANTYLIYGVISAAHHFKTRQAIAFLVFALSIFFAESFAIGLPTAFSIGTTLIASIMVFYTVYGKQMTLSNQHLKLSQEEVQRLAQRAERERIARDLHDMLGHTLSLIVMKSELANKLFEHDQVAAKNHIQDVEKIARESLAQVRAAVSGIRLMKLEAEIANARLSLLTADIHLHYQLATVELSADIETIFAMTVREAITNIIRHANAKHVEIELRIQQRELLLQISDDGKGGEIVAGNGIHGMRERLQTINATLNIEKSATGGVRLTVRAPQR